MNGRAYDYNLGRFLSVDPFIQAPGNSQSMNPYSYIMNNPLAGTDPSGYKGECEVEASCANVKVEKGDKIIHGKDGSKYLDKGDKDSLIKIESTTAKVNGIQLTVNLKTLDYTIKDTSELGSQSQTAKSIDSIASNKGTNDDSETITYEQTQNTVTAVGATAGTVEEYAKARRSSWADKFKQSVKTSINLEKAMRIGQAIGRAAFAISAGARLLEADNKLDHITDSMSKIDEISDTTLDIAYGAIAFTGPVGIGVAIVYFGVDQYHDGNAFSATRNAIDNISK